MYYEALKDPLWYSFQIRLNERLVELICKGWLHYRLPLRPSRPFWSLQKVLDHLAPPLFSLDVSAERKLKNALFLVAHATVGCSHEVSCLDDPRLRLGKDRPGTFIISFGEG